MDDELTKLAELTSHLRGPDGCPWDRAQDYDSVKELLLEEAYEVVDAVNARDFDAMEDELGDLLFQVVFYSRLAEEEERFTLDDVVRRVHAKLVRRHPHVFGETRAANAEEALKSWLSVKEKEREAKGEAGDSSSGGPASSAPGNPPPSLLDGIPRTLPSTLEAFELGTRVAEVGFDWTKVGEVLDKIEEEVRELRQELNEQGLADVGTPRDYVPRDSARIEEEVGDLLFTAANLARYLRSDPETCLRRANQKFALRFRKLEQEVARRGKRVRDCGAEELDEIWNAVKGESKVES
ncbi:MAG: nucleoside triphosphate pyrophosphohydrolase [Terriglobia bacterium]